ncbi:unnamed protein product, partial [marine sediment metagenome]
IPDEININIYKFINSLIINFIYREEFLRD